MVDLDCIIPLISYIDNLYESMWVSNALIVVTNEKIKEKMKSLLKLKHYPIGTKLTLIDMNEFLHMTEGFNIFDTVLISKMIINHYGFSVLNKIDGGIEQNFKHGRIILLI
jgi:hypothetical protein